MCPDKESVVAVLKVPPMSTETIASTVTTSVGWPGDISIFSLSKTEFSVQCWDREDIVSSYNAVLATQNALKMLHMPPRIVEAKRPSFLTNQQSDKLTLKQAAVAARVRWNRETGAIGMGSAV